VSLDFGEEVTFAADGQKLPQAWANYILGVVMEFHSRCFAVPGFDAVFAGDVPVGGRHVVFGSARKRVCVRHQRPRPVRHLTPRARRNRAGRRTQICWRSLRHHGPVRLAARRWDHLIQLDCRSLEFELVPFQLPGYRVVLLDTKVKHSLASSEYNNRRADCEAGVKAIQKINPQVQSLRDADLAMLEAARSLIEPATFTRCQYVIEENARVLNAVSHLKTGNIAAFGQEMYASHEGLQHKYNVSCDELDLLVEIARQSGVTGARMMGGGFGGCTINVVSEAAYAGFIHEAERRFAATFGRAPLCT
jgi:galactokinase